jgi:hypothetical protein
VIGSRGGSDQHFAANCAQAKRAVGTTAGEKCLAFPPSRENVHQLGGDRIREFVVPCEGGIIPRSPRFNAESCVREWISTFSLPKLCGGGGVFEVTSPIGRLWND